MFVAADEKEWHPLKNKSVVISRHTAPLSEPQHLFCSLWWRSNTVLATKVAPSPQWVSGLVFTACIVLSFPKARCIVKAYLYIVSFLPLYITLPEFWWRNSTIPRHIILSLCGEHHVCVCVCVCVCACVCVYMRLSDSRVYFKHRANRAAAKNMDK